MRRVYMEYINIINEETRLNEQLKALKEKYNAEVLKISNRLVKLSQYKEDFINGDSSFVFAREYISVDNPFMLLCYFRLYMKSLKKELTKDYTKLLTHNLQIQDNAHGGDTVKYTTLVKKNHSISYHPNLGSINFSYKMPVQYFSKLVIELEKLDIEHIKIEKLPIGDFYFQLRVGFDNMPHILAFNIKTEEYDYTNLLKLLNFPEEFYISSRDNTQIGMYKLIDDSYVFHLLDSYSNQWRNISEEYDKFYDKK